MKEKNHLFSATGIPSLFLIFGVLMLVILSLLGYGTSRQDLRASSLSLEQTSAYYNACSEAADFYSELVQTLEGFQEQAKTETAYYQLVSDYLNSQENVNWNSEEHTAEYVKAFSDTQSLAVKIVVFWTDCTADSTASATAAFDNVASDNVASDNAASDNVVSDNAASDNAASDNAASDTINAGLDMTSSNIAGILSWNTIVTADWNPDNSQSVYKGNNFMEEKVKAFLELATQKKASDIFIIAGRPLSVKIDGKRCTLDGFEERLMPPETDEFIRIIYKLAHDRNIEPMLETGDDDFPWLSRVSQDFV